MGVGGALRSARLAVVLLAGCTASPPAPQGAPLPAAPLQAAGASPPEAGAPQPTPPYVLLHTVAVGDTLSEIALRYAVDVGDLARANGIEDRDHIRLGQEIRILIEAPPPRTAEGTSRNRELVVENAAELPGR